MVALNSDYSSARTDVEAKNRVGDFFYEVGDHVGENRPASREGTREIRLTLTIIASGIPYWPNRDPIEEWGGLNLFTFAKNSSVNYLDVLGRNPIQVNSVDVRYKQYIKNGPRKGSNIYVGRAYFDLELDTSTCTLNVIVNSYANGDVSEEFLSAVEEHIEDIWGQFKLCCTCSKKLKCPSMEINVDLRWGDRGINVNFVDDIYEVNQANWPSQISDYYLNVAAHEFGHTLGNTDEYGEVYLWSKRHKSWFLSPNESPDGPTSMMEDVWENP